MTIPKHHRTFLGVLLLTGLIGCATTVPKTWNAVGGSRADATVELSYEYYPATENPVLNDLQADSIALKRCESWGYHSAVPFGGIKVETYPERTLLVPTTRKVVTKVYQCLGKGDEEVEVKLVDPRTGQTKML